MYLNRTLQIIAFGSATMMAATVQAQEKKIARKDLPAAVEKTVSAESQGATIKGFSTEIDHGKKVYEAQLMVAGHGRDLTIDAQGQILEVEEEVALAALPPAVRDGLTKQTGAAKFVKVESLTKGKLVAYEAVVKRGTKQAEIQVGPDGKKLAHPE